MFSIARNAVGPLRVAAVTTVPSQNLGGARHMSANLRDVKKRMVSVKSIAKITKAMKMVAASKLRHVQKAMDASRPFQGAVADFFDNVVPKEGDVKKEHVVAISSDKGLCGGVNSAISKAVRLHVDNNSGVDIEVTTVGDKSRGQLQRLYSGYFANNFKDVGKNGHNFAQACDVTATVMEHEYDQLRIIYNKYESAISFVPTTRVIPKFESIVESEDTEKLDLFDFDADKSSVFQDVYEFYVASSVYSSLLENGTSEMASRMQAMDKATNAANDMISALELLYNRTRQAVITTELIEIISGAESLKD